MTATDSREAVQATPTPTPERPADGRGDLNITDLFRYIYRLLYSKTVGVGLILAMAVLAFIGAMITQTSRAALADPASKAQFLTDMRGKYGGWTTVLDVLGFFHMFTSPIFLTVSALLAASIIACTVHRIPQLVRRVTEPRTHVSEKFFDRARYRGDVPFTGAGDAALETTRAQLKRKGFRVIADPQNPTGALYADRYSWSGMGTVVAHASFVIIMMALLISSLGGVDKEYYVPVGGDPVAIDGTTVAIQAESFKDTYDDEGRPADYVSRLILRDGGTVIRTQDVRVNSPLTYGKYKFHQNSFGIAADIKVTDAEGKVVFAGSVPMKWTSEDGTNAVGRVDLTEPRLDVIVVTPASGRTDSTISPGTAVFEIYQPDTNQPEAVETAQQGKTVEAVGHSFTFERERQYTGIRLRQDPGAIWMWIGSVLLVAGMTVTFALPYRRLWVRIDEDHHRIRFASVEKQDFAFNRLFSDVIRNTWTSVSAKKTTHHGGLS